MHCRVDIETARQLIGTEPKAIADIDLERVVAGILRADRKLPLECSGLHPSDAADWHSDVLPLRVRQVQRSKIAGRVIK